MVGLYLVTTPIGNLSDITQRAKDTLSQSDLIIAEDTRSTRALLEHLGIEATGKKIIAFHDHNKEKTQGVISLIKNAKMASLVSDAGSPIISDPAFPLVRACIEEDIQIYSAPGVSAVTSALELSGLAPQPYTFHGFFGRKKGEILDKLEHCSGFGGTHIFFESPHRIESSLKTIAAVYPDCDMALCREITKKFETAYRFKASQWQEQQINFKGEFVLLINFKEPRRASNKGLEELANKYMQKKTPKNLSKLLAQVLDQSVSEVYENLSK